MRVVVPLSPPSSAHFHPAPHAVPRNTVGEDEWATVRAETFLAARPEAGVTLPEGGF